MIRGLISEDDTLYMLKNGKGDNALYKVGYSSNIHSRLETYITHNPNTEILHTGGNWEDFDCRQWELDFHSKHKADFKNEWYSRETMVGIYGENFEESAEDWIKVGSISRWSLSQTRIQYESGYPIDLLDSALFILNKGIERGIITVEDALTFNRVKHNPFCFVEDFIKRRVDSKENYNYHYYSYMKGKFNTEAEYREFIDELTTKLQES